MTERPYSVRISHVYCTRGYQVIKIILSRYIVLEISAKRHKSFISNVGLARGPRLLSTPSFSPVLTIFSRLSALVLFLFRFHSRRLPSLHRVAALKIMYFRGQVGRFFFLLRSPSFVVCYHLSPLSLSLSHSSHSVLFPSILSLSFYLRSRESRCNNGCPLIIGRPRHFKEIPRAHHETQFRSLLKISFSLSLCSLSLHLFLFLFLSRVRETSVTKTINIADLSVEN